MDIVQLRYFKTVAETGHLTNAAKLLNVAQPALSVSISRLENEVGVPLFDRQSRRIRLNQYGEAYLKHVEQALRILEQAQNEILTMKDRNENIVNLGVVSKLFSHMFLIGFKKKFPESRIRSFDIMPDGIEEELLSGEVDYVLASRKSEHPEITGEEIISEHFFLAASADSRYADCAQLSLHDLREETFISLPAGYEHRMITDEICKKHGFIPNVMTECFHCHMSGLIASGAGVALVTETFVEKNHTNRQLRLIPITDPDCVRHYYLLWKKERRFNKMAENFRCYVNEYYSNCVQKEPCSCRTEL